MKQRVLSKYAVIEKSVGETPLQALERFRSELGLSQDVPLAYAGRLDPMASGSLLVLIGDECKRQKKYHALDKQYVCEVLLGAHSDTGDVLGIVKNTGQKIITEDAVTECERHMPQTLTLPYPHFSSKTVQGKPLHTWTLEGRIDEISVPKKLSHIYAFKATGLRIMPLNDVITTAREKIKSLPPVTDARKELGADFRRDKVYEAWEAFEQTGYSVYQILSFECIVTSGTYMRSLAAYIGKKLGTTGLAFSIHRKTIGRYVPITKNLGFWRKKY